MSRLWRNIRLAIALIVGVLSLTVLSACDVHEFPEIEVPRDAKLHLVLQYQTDMPQWEYPLTEGRTEVPSKSVQTTGEMRYIIELYPQNSKNYLAPAYEFVFTRDVAGGYNAEFDLEVPAGVYDIMVWSDLAEYAEGSRFYNASDFSQIVLQGKHQGNNDYRDAFRGTLSAALASTPEGRAGESLVVEMVRPLAKYEFVTTDLNEFIDKEVAAALSRGEQVSANAPSKGIDLTNYNIEIRYVGYMPNTFNMFTDRPSDAVTGIIYSGKLTQLANDEASLGFDYVFVNGVETAVTVQVGIYDKEGNCLSMSGAIRVPLQRSKHTLLKGRFLTQDASGGVGIDASFDGEWNIFL